MGNSNKRKTYIIGVGKTAYEKPRNRIGYEELGLQAATKALLDAGITCVSSLTFACSATLLIRSEVRYDDIEQAYVGCKDIY